MIPCYDCKALSPVEEMTQVYGLPSTAQRCQACMRDRTAACQVMQELRGEKNLADRGHSAGSAYRQRARKDAGRCLACRQESPSALCRDCRLAGEAYWAKASAS